MASKFDILAGIVLEDFENVADFTIAGGTAEESTEHVEVGSKSLKLTSGVGTNCIATKTISVNLNSLANAYIYVYIEELAPIASLQIILSNDSGFANFYSHSPTAILHEGLNRIPIGRLTWVTSGSPNWANDMVRLRVRVNANVGQTAVVWYDSLVYGYRGRPKCIISADDGWATQYTELFPYMRKYGFRGSLYLIKQRINTAGYMTTAQVQEMFAAGWDIMNHTDNHFNMKTDLSTQAQVEAELTACRDWIIANGWSRDNGENHVAYPNGGYDQKVLDAMAALRMTTGRSIINRNQAHELDNKYLLVRQSHAFTASAATYKGYINKAIADGSMVQINYHKIEPDGTSDVDTEVDVSQMRGLLDHLYEKRAEIDVITHLDWTRGLKLGRRPA